MYVRLLGLFYPNEGPCDHWDRFWDGQETQLPFAIQLRTTPDSSRPASRNNQAVVWNSSERLCTKVCCKSQEHRTKRVRSFCYVTVICEAELIFKLPVSLRHCRTAPSATLWRRFWLVQLQGRRCSRITFGAAGSRCCLSDQVSASKCQSFSSATFDVRWPRSRSEGPGKLLHGAVDSRLNVTQLLSITEYACRDSIERPALGAASWELAPVGVKANTNSTHHTLQIVSRTTPAQ